MTRRARNIYISEGIHPIFNYCLRRWTSVAGKYLCARGRVECHWPKHPEGGGCEVDDRVVHDRSHTNKDLRGCSKFKQKQSPSWSKPHQHLSLSLSNAALFNVNTRSNSSFPKRPYFHPSQFHRSRRIISETAESSSSSTQPASPLPPPLLPSLQPS